MKAMILAAGKGTRLEPLTSWISKPMVPVANKPIMEHVIDLLASQGLRELVVNLHYKPEPIKDYFRDGSGWGVKLTYSSEKSLLGTAGGLKRVQHFFKDSTFVVFSSDLLTDIDLAPLVRMHRKRKALATIALTTVEDPSKYGVVQTDDSGRVIAFQEKPTREQAVGNSVNCGIYIFEPEIFDYIPPGEFYDFGRDLFPLLFNEGERLYAFEHYNYWTDIGSLETFLHGNFDALRGRVKLNLPGSMIPNSIWVGDKTTIDDSVEMKAPLLIGNNCEIRRGARLIGPTIIGDSSVIEEGAILRTAISLAHMRFNLDRSKVNVTIR
jgi:NDP-sugar pyrophosphorylase family protein